MNAPAFDNRPPAGPHGRGCRCAPRVNLPDGGSFVGVPLDGKKTQLESMAALVRKLTPRVDVPDQAVPLPDGNTVVGLRTEPASANKVVSLEQLGARIRKDFYGGDAPPDGAPLPAIKQQVGGGHYKGLAIQPVEYCQRNNLGFCESSVVKYVTRYKSKRDLEDLLKARHFIDLLIEIEYGSRSDLITGSD